MMQFVYVLLSILSCSLIMFLVMIAFISDKQTFYKILEKTLVQIPSGIIKKESIPWLMHIILTLFVWVPMMAIYPVSPVILAFILYCSSKQEVEDDNETD